MKALLDEPANLTGSDFEVTPMPGCGSYQSGSTASGSTTTGGAHIDIYITGYSTSKKHAVVALARNSGFYADIRESKWWSPTRNRWLTAKWTSHLHAPFRRSTP